MTPNTNDRGDEELKRTNLDPGIIGIHESIQLCAGPAACIPHEYYYYYYYGWPQMTFKQARLLPLIVQPVDPPL